jgi:hypothetical protein
MEKENINISCDICKYSKSHDYISNHYYCENRCFSGDKPMVHNCSEGELDEWVYNLKYKPLKSDENVSKELMYEELKQILWGIKLKDIDTIMKEINALKEKITSYREPYKCETCAVETCDLYAAGCRNCSGWK